MIRTARYVAATAFAFILMAAALSIVSASADRGLVSGQAQAQSGAQDESPVIEVSAKKYEFNPGSIHVKNGTHVRLKVTATDREHGIEFEIYAKGSNKKGDPGLVFSVQKPTFKLPKGEAQTIEFDAKQPGTYELHCAVMCGLGHHGMKGEIVVDP